MLAWDVLQTISNALQITLDGLQICYLSAFVVPWTLADWFAKSGWCLLDAEARQSN
jgi:hypothetical protein